MKAGNLPESLKISQNLPTAGNLRAMSTVLKASKHTRAEWLEMKRAECAARYVACGWELGEAKACAERTYTVRFAASLGF